MLVTHVTVTIKDVARRANVSIATVSHVLNNTRFVSDELTARVNEAVRELGYYPNRLVGSMRTGKTYTVGLVLPSIANETFGHLAETIQRLLFKFGYNLIICSTAYDLEIEREAFNTLLMKKADAILAVPTCREPDKLREISGMGIPVVVIDRVIPGLSVDTVRVDNLRGTHDAIAHLLDLGHRRIGYLDRKVDQSHSVEQKLGYKRALEERGLPFEQTNMVRADGYDYHAGISAAKALLRRNPGLTAVFAYYDIIALGAIRGILDLGYRIPEDFSVVGYDGMPFTNASWPRLTTVEFPVHRVAKNACDLLMRRLEHPAGREGREQDISFVPKLIVRDSTGAPPDRSAV
jgi:LacI family transcriptional regulator